MFPEAAAASACFLISASTIFAAAFRATPSTCCFDSVSFRCLRRRLSAAETQARTAVVISWSRAASSGEEGLAAETVSRFFGAGSPSSSPSPAFASFFSRASSSSSSASAAARAAAAASFLLLRPRRFASSLARAAC